MGTIRDVFQLDLHAMQVKALAVDFGGVMSDFIDRDTLSLLADMAQVPLDAFEIPYWERRDRLDSGEYDAYCYFHHVLTDCYSPLRDDEETLQLLFTIDLLGFSHIRPRMVRWVCDMRSRGIKTVLVSNMASETYERLVHGTYWATACFDLFVISGILGMNKPEKPIFHHVIEQVQTAPQHILFIDDAKRNIETAKSMGMQTFLYT
ncbi:HAD family hydrolase [Sphaerochaeta halotolerans]|uniref:HAD family hydrolase n=1 Tax=Sphaerochaeta halotolerans TaxID=2293840 RepID=A0A372MK56_9SPIR|nr:HAD-IA family hydrolase [Sphaerochaeta halotolerans]MDN5333376.1 putative hydrolase of the superfamily [Sphaerochaeta sp.]RFU96187.1 HAD family hydrolase [Sphaerochaeta halotolerans]